MYWCIWTYVVNFLMSKTLQEQLAEGEVSPERHEIYDAVGGLSRVLEPALSPEARIERARRHRDAVRESAKLDEQTRACQKRQEQMAKEAESEEKARRVENKESLREFESHLAAQLRTEYPPMSDEAWADL
jgi:hypothetical protein